MPLARCARFAADDPEDLLPRPDDLQRFGEVNCVEGRPGQEIIDSELRSNEITAPSSNRLARDS
jgi:hypothetical protein